MGSNFEWNDDNILEFVKELRHNYSKGYPIVMAIEEFKNSKAIPKETKPIQDKDWKIGVVLLGKDKYYRNSEGLFYMPQYNVGYFYPESEIIKIGGTIYTIKRLFDDEIFKIGSKTTHGTIEKFFEGWAGMEVHYKDGSAQRLSVVEKVKPKVPLFTTEDGVEIFTDSKEWLTLVDKYFQSWDCNIASASWDKNIKYFVNKSKAKEYILQNKPIKVSLNDLHPILYEKTEGRGYRIDIEQYSRLLDYFKSKINP